MLTTLVLFVWFNPFERVMTDWSLYMLDVLRVYAVWANLLYHYSLITSPFDQRLYRQSLKIFLYQNGKKRSKDCEFKEWLKMEWSSTRDCSVWISECCLGCLSGWVSTQLKKMDSIAVVKNELHIFFLLTFRLSFTPMTGLCVVLLLTFYLACLYTDCKTENMVIIIFK